MTDANSSNWQPDIGQIGEGKFALVAGNKQHSGRIVGKPAYGLMDIEDMVDAILDENRGIYGNVEPCEHEKCQVDIWVYNAERDELAYRGIVCSETLDVGARS